VATKIHCLEDGLPGIVGSDRIIPIFISQEKAIWMGNNRILRGLAITMVINHLPTGMMLQVVSQISQGMFAVFVKLIGF